MIKILNILSTNLYILLNSVRSIRKDRVAPDHLKYSSANPEPWRPSCRAHEPMASLHPIPIRTPQCESLK